MPVKRSRNNSLYGFPNPTSNQFPDPIVTNAAPSIYDQGEPGQLWIDQTEEAVYAFIQFSSGSAVWLDLAGASGSFTSLTVGDVFSASDDAGVTISSGAQNTNIAGSEVIIFSPGIISLTSNLVGLPLVPSIEIYATDAAGTVAISANAGITLNGFGLATLAPITGSVASPTATATQNFNVIRQTFTGFTTASASSQAFTIVSSKILATSGIFVNVASLNTSGNNAKMTIEGVTQAVGSIIVNTTNNGAGALGAGDNVLITVWIIS